MVSDLSVTQGDRAHTHDVTRSEHTFRHNPAVSSLFCFAIDENECGHLHLGRVDQRSKQTSPHAALLEKDSGIWVVEGHIPQGGCQCPGVSLLQGKHQRLGTREQFRAPSVFPNPRLIKLLLGDPFFDILSEVCSASFSILYSVRAMSSVFSHG
jgi:hypothetical protein